MRRIAIGAALTGVGAVAARALAPRVHARLLGACERMFEQMPDTSPPRRALRSIEEIHANTARTLELLQEHRQAVEAAPHVDAAAPVAAAHAAPAARR